MTTTATKSRPILFSGEMVREGLGLYHTAVGAFDASWTQRHGPASWASNPWVWVITFEPVKGGVS